MACGFYREGAELPHKPIPLAVFLIVEEAIRVSWQRLKCREISKIQSADEDDITLYLYEVIFDEIFDKGVVDGFDKERFSNVTREAKVRNYDRTQPDKRPDLLISVSGRDEVYRRSQDWLFIECKPIDSEHTVGVHYGAKGIARFIRGEYAWAMTSALMVGYARSGYTIESKLHKTLKSRTAEFKVIEMPKRCRLSPQNRLAERVYSTVHSRPFNYQETAQPAPSISLRHLWLRRN